MTLIERLKRDKKFRLKAFFIVLLIAMFWISAQPDKKEASPEVCNVFNGGITFLLSPAEHDGCLAASCGVKVPVGTDTVFTFGTADVGECINKNLLATTSKCSAQIGVGETFAAQSQSAANSLCSPGRALPTGSKLCTTPTYTCIPEETGQACGNNMERSIGGVIDSVWKTNDLGCKTKFMVVLFGGGLLILLMLLAVL